MRCSEGRVTYANWIRSIQEHHNFSAYRGEASAAQAGNASAGDATIGGSLPFAERRIQALDRAIALGDFTAPETAAFSQYV